MKIGAQGSGRKGWITKRIKRLFSPNSPNTMPQIVIQSREIIPQHGFPGTQIIRESEITVIQAEGEEIVVLVSLFLRIRLAPAPQQQAAAAASAESHIYIYSIADYPGNIDKPDIKTCQWQSIKRNRDERNDTRCEKRST